MDVKEPAEPYKKNFISEVEYIEHEKHSTEKCEYYKGEIFAMAGAGVKHNIIFKNILRDLSDALRGKSCQPYGSDLRIHVPEISLFTYPDISIICGDIISSPIDVDTATQPSAII